MGIGDDETVGADDESGSQTRGRLRAWPAAKAGMPGAVTATADATMQANANFERPRMNRTPSRFAADRLPNDIGKPRMVS